MEKNVSVFLMLPLETASDIFKLNFKAYKLFGATSHLWKHYLMVKRVNCTINCRFSHDVTKIQTTKLLILLIFYLNEV